MEIADQKACVFHFYPFLPKGVIFTLNCAPKSDGDQFTPQDRILDLLLKQKKECSEVKYENQR